MDDCSRTVSPDDAANLGALIGSLPDGAVLCLKPGNYRSKLSIVRSITLRGLGSGVVLDAAGSGMTVHVIEDKLNVVVENLTLRGGAGPMGRGSNLTVSGDSQVTLREVTLDDGAFADGGVGGALVDDGTAVFERCQLRRNGGRRAAALLVTRAGKVRLKSTRIVDNPGPGPSVRAEGGVELTLDAVTIWSATGDPLELGRIGTNEPEVAVNRSIIGPGPLRIAPARQRRSIQVRASALSHPVPADVDGGGNVVGEIKLDDQFRPTAGSLGAGRGAM